MKKPRYILRQRFLTLLGFGLFGLATTNLFGQTSFTSNTATTAWNAARWNNSADAAPYDSLFTANNNVVFTSGNYSFAGMGATTNVGNITVNAGANVSFSTGSTFATGGNVRTIDVAAGSLFDFNGLSLSSAAGTGFVKNGLGTLGTGAGNFTGGFTLNAGTVIARGTTGMGSGSTNVLTLNGGTVASNATRSFDNTRFGSGIVIGGNVQFGELAANVTLASSTANLSFANNVSLGGSNRILTLGNNGTQTLSGVISNSGTGGLSFAANSGVDGRFEITNTGNTFAGNISVNGGEVRFTSDGSLGNSSNSVVIDGGRFAKASDSTTFTLGAARQVFVGDGVGTSISTPGTGTLVINSGISDVTGKTGSWAKQGAGVIELGGVSSYSGSTAINNGTLRLVGGDNRLPTGTVVSLGQAASANLGTLDLNGQNQQIAGLNSVTGTNVGTARNTVSSSSAATLTLGGNGNYAFGDGTTGNSGVISGSINLVKIGSGTQILGDANTYTGSTTINGGTLALGANGSIASTSISVGTNGTFDVSAVTGGYDLLTGRTLSGDGTIVGDVNINSGAFLNPGTSPGSLAFTGDLTNSGTITIELDSATSFDTLLGNGSNVFTLGGTLNIVTNFTPVVGQTLNIFSGWQNIVGNFSTINGADLGGGLSWQISTSGGNLSFSAVPEPSSMALLGLVGLGGFAVRRFRNKKVLAAQIA